MAFLDRFQKAPEISPVDSARIAAHIPETLSRLQDYRVNGLAHAALGGALFLRPGQAQAIEDNAHTHQETGEFAAIKLPDSQQAA